MENQVKSSEDSGYGDDELSFTDIPMEEESFEFGCGQTTAESPKSPADDLFLNGKLQPHDFPTSRTSSVRSVDSLYSSRSNSTNSSCSSAGTSIREASGSSDSERKSSLSQRAKVAAGHRKNSLSREEHSFWKEYYQQAKKPALTPDFGSSLRWQFITPVSGLKSRKFRNIDLETEMKENGSGATAAGAWSGRRVVRFFMTACLSCHAMNPAGAEQ